MTRLMHLMDNLDRNEFNAMHDMQAKGGLTLTEINRLLDHMQQDKAIHNFLHMQALLQLVLSIDRWVGTVVLATL